MWENVTEVEPGVYISGKETACDKTRLLSLKITHILNCAGFACANFFEPEFIYLTLPLKDKPKEPIEGFFYESYRFIAGAKEAGGRVLVHCVCGVSRSVSILLSYQILRYQSCFPLLFTALQCLRPCINPNPGYLSQLQTWSARLLTPGLLPYPRLYQSIYLSSTPCIRSTPPTLDVRSITIIHLPGKIYLWTGKLVTSEEFCTVSDRFVCDLIRFEDKNAVKIGVKQGEEIEEFWTDLHPCLPKDSYSKNEENDRYFVVKRRENSDLKGGFYIYPDVIPYKSIPKSDLNESICVLFYSETEAFTYTGTGFTPDILTSDEYLSMLSTRLNTVPRVLTCLEDLVSLVTSLGEGS